MLPGECRKLCTTYEYIFPVLDLQYRCCAYIITATQDLDYLDRDLHAISPIIKPQQQIRDLGTTPHNRRIHSTPHST